MSFIAPLSEDELRSALQKAKTEGDFSTVRSILSQPHGNPKWLEENQKQ